jgi:hypothetical protein
MDMMKPDFIEAAMYMASIGPYAGQYVASCAQDLCGYFGKRLANVMVNLGRYVTDSYKLQWSWSTYTTKWAYLSGVIRVEVDF